MKHQLRSPCCKSACRAALQRGLLLSKTPHLQSVRNRGKQAVHKTDCWIAHAADTQRSTPQSSIDALDSLLGSYDDSQEDASIAQLDIPVASTATAEPMSVAARTTNPGAVEHTSEQALGIQEALIQTASGQGNVAMLKQAAVHSATKWVKDKLETKSSLLDVADKQYEVPKVTPLLTYVILIFNISLYIAGLALRFGKGESSAEDYFYMLALVDEEVAHGEYYRLLTSSFMHDSFQHLALNVFALFQIAPEVESVLGYQTFLAVYLLAGLGGSTATFIFGDTITVGASSCIFGLIGAMGGYLWKNRSVQSQGQLTLVGLVVAVNLVMGSKDSSSIDNLGHVAGLFSGLYLGWGMAPRLVAPPQSADADNTAASSQQQQKTTNASLERQSSMGGNLRTQRDTPVSQSNKQTSAKEQPPSVPKIKAIDSITAIQRWAIPMTFGTINVLLLAVTVQERTGILPMPKGLGL